MKTINDIIAMIMIYKDMREYCPAFTCGDCPKEFFCWATSRLIALEYIMREGQI